MSNDEKEAYVKKEKREIKENIIGKYKDKKSKKKRSGLAKRKIM